MTLDVTYAREKFKVPVSSAIKFSAFSGVSHALSDCTITTGTVPTESDLRDNSEGWIKLFLSNPFTIGHTSRRARFDTYKNTPIPKFDAHSDSQGFVNDPKPKIPPTHTNQKNHFHLYLWKLYSNANHKRFVEVFVIIEQQSKFTFGVLDDINPVAVGIAGADPVLYPSAAKRTCLVPNTQPVLTPVNGRQIARFFVDINNLTNAGAESVFNIILSPEDGDETPIIIDPKIYNEG